MEEAKFIYAQDFSWSMDENGFRRGKAKETVNGKVTLDVDTLDEEEFTDAVSGLLNRDDDEIKGLAEPDAKSDE